MGKEFAVRYTVVGPDRLELSTSVLSGPRSNHLSYGPTSSKLYLCPNGGDKMLCSYTSPDRQQAGNAPHPCHRILLPQCAYASSQVT